MECSEGGCRVAAAYKGPDADEARSRGFKIHRQFLYLKINLVRDCSSFSTL